MGSRMYVGVCGKRLLVTLDYDLNFDESQEIKKTCISLNVIKIHSAILAFANAEGRTDRKIRKE